jgi:thiamine transport system permease protein
VTLPLLAPSILAATLLVFLFDFTSFGVVLLLGGPRFATLEVEIYIQAMNLFNLPLAGLLSAIQMLCTLLLTVAHARLNGRAAQLSPRVRGSDVRKARSLGERVLVVAVIITVMVLLVSPLAALGLRSFTRMEAERGERGEVKTG